MSDFDLAGEFCAVVNSRLMHVTQADRRRVSESLFNWLSLTAMKKQVPDLSLRLERWRGRIDRLADGLEVKFSGDDIVVKAAGDADTTLRLLERGSDWFEPCDNVRELIIAAFYGNTAS